MSIYYQDDQVRLYHGDAIEVARELPSGAADCIVTSPPYFGLRDYGIDGQYGLESSPVEYVETMRGLFTELRRVLADDGTLWLNIGDSYATSPRGNKNGSGIATSRLRNPEYQERLQRGAIKNFPVPVKNLLGIPWRVAFALQDDGWILRNAIIWNKPNAMPESVTDRLSGRYEHVFLFSKQRAYWFDLDPIRDKPSTSGGLSWEQRKTLGDGSGNREIGRWNTKSFSYAVNENGRNPGDVWTINTQPFAAAHFAVMPPQLAQRCILAGCPPRRCQKCGFTPAPGVDDIYTTNGTDCRHKAHQPGTVLDPFSGSGTTGLAAQRTGRKYIGIDLNAEYLELSLNHPQRLSGATLDFGEPA